MEIKAQLSTFLKPSTRQAWTLKLMYRSPRKITICQKFLLVPFSCFCHRQVLQEHGKEFWMP